MVDLILCWKNPLSVNINKLQNCTIYIKCTVCTCMQSVQSEQNVQDLNSVPVCLNVLIFIGKVEVYYSVKGV